MTDPGGLSDEDEVEITVQDTIAPTVSVEADPLILWPPNHKMVDVTITGLVEDGGSGVESATLVVTDEYGEWDSTVPLALQPDGSFRTVIQLEAWREGQDRDGRGYLLTVIATDRYGNEGIAEVGVWVPHDQR